MSNMSSSELAPERRSIDQSKIAYQLYQPVGIVPDAFVGAALDLDGDEREWVPQSPTVAFRPLIPTLILGNRRCRLGCQFVSHIWHAEYPFFRLHRNELGEPAANRTWRKYSQRQDRYDDR
ncbi:hypothetical protein IC762_29625 [Bradyrhizobium genosp. L]|uniref:hypothetical protein n=1 Tax=Bradyrhizobium genosp. L TaxID=83637 RepID=UPI0018A2B055|nr:hypothetical protein [Bradyrhizobium genosp. L]QPF83807.1 hypothetical protein IC762_29625 [Bradyrhizobium genosp. L]